VELPEGGRLEYIVLPADNCYTTTGRINPLPAALLAEIRDALRDDVPSLN
jgi:hypothetical protein